MVSDLPTDIISLVGFMAMIGYMIFKDQRDRTARKHHTKVIGEVRDQVSNSHDSNLRDDIDKLINAVDRIDSKQDTHGTTLSKFMREMYASAARWDRIAAKYHPEES